MFNIFYQPIFHIFPPFIGPAAECPGLERHQSLGDRRHHALRGAGAAHPPAPGLPGAGQTGARRGRGRGIGGGQQCGWLPGT